MNLALAQVAGWVTAVGIVFFLFVSIVMVLIVLIQRPQGGGLGGAFGGGAAGSGQTAFGARTGDVLTWATITIFLAFLVTAVLLNFAVRPDAAPIPTLAPASGGPADVPIDGSATIPLTPTQTPAGAASDQPVDPPAAPPIELPTSAEPPAPGGGAGAQSPPDAGSGG